MKLKTGALQFLLFLAIGLFFIGLGLVIPSVFGTIQSLGHNIPSNRLTGDFTIALGWALFFFVILTLLPNFKTFFRHLPFLWVIRCLVTLVAMLFYEDRYGLDAYQYFLTSKFSYFPFEQVSYGHGTSIIGSLSWMMNHFLPVNDSYHALKVIFSFIGFTAINIFYLAFRNFWGKDSIKLLYLLHLFPSILFWSSILGKDPVTLLGISIYTYGALSLIQKKQAVSTIWIALGVFIASGIRVWSGLILLAPLGMVLVYKSKIGAVKKIAVTGSIAVVFLFVFEKFQERFNVDSAQEVVETSQRISRSWSRGGAGQEVPEFHSIQDMLLFSPKGVFAAVFRPLPFEIKSVFGSLAGLENFILLALFLIGLKRARRETFKRPEIQWAGLYIFIWAFIYGFVSYQNLGSAVRFKLQILPILINLLLYIIHLTNIREDHDVQPEIQPKT